VLVDQAESLLTQYADPIRVAAIAEQGVRDDEWRLQRIRPFDWYTVDYKRQAQRDLQAKYWRMWSIEVRCYRHAGQPEKAAELLAVMEHARCHCTAVRTRFIGMLSPRSSVCMEREDRKIWRLRS
jgi:pentatricopeptide repeat protein